MSVSPQTNSTPQPVKCICKHVIFDGEVIKSRCVKPGIETSYALCKCKRWVNVPILLKKV